MFIEEITITTRKDLFVPKPAVRDENFFPKPTVKLLTTHPLLPSNTKEHVIFHHVIEDWHRMLQQYLLTLYP